MLGFLELLIAEFILNIFFPLFKAPW